MMTLISRLIPGAPVLAAGMFLTALTMAHGWWKEAQAHRVAATRQQCNDQWQLALASKARDVAQLEAAAAREQLLSERRANEELKDAIQGVRAKYAELQASASSDPRCLSSSVLDALRNR